MGAKRSSSKSVPSQVQAHRRYSSKGACLKLLAATSYFLDSMPFVR